MLSPRARGESVRPRLQSGACTRPLSFTVMRLSVLALAVLFCACASRGLSPSDAFASCSVDARSGWTLLQSPPQEAGLLRQIRDDRYGQITRSREYWFSGPDHRVLLCLPSHKPPEWYWFMPSANTWSVQNETVVIR
jgi:hypothetical protein